MDYYECYRCGNPFRDPWIDASGVGSDGKEATIRVCVDCAYAHEVLAEQKRGAAWASQMSRREAKAVNKRRKLKFEKERRKREEEEGEKILDLESKMVEMDEHLARPLAVRCKEHEGRKGKIWKDARFVWTETGELDPLIVVEHYHRLKGRCAYCHQALNFNFNIEHRTPPSRGGTNNKNNITISCASCNEDKGTMTAGEYVPLLRKQKKKTVIVRKKDGKETRKILAKR